MKISEFLINEDVVDFAQRRQAKQAQTAEKKFSNQQDQIDIVIDQLDHAFAQALDDITDIVGDETKALEIISNHVGVFYDDDVQY